MYWFLLLVPLALLAWGIMEARYALKVRTHELGTRGVRIVWASDFHCRWWYPPSCIRRIADRIASLNPDIVIFGGDFVDAGEQYVDACIGELSRAGGSTLTAAVLGNHDIQWSRGSCPRNRIVSRLEQAGIRLLHNTSVTAAVRGIPVQIIGTADLSRDVSYIGHLAQDPKAQLVILASHNPDFVPLADTLPFDVALCGHTHGGQITFFGIPVTTHTRHRRSLGRGRCSFAGRTVIVSFGTGTTILPIRFCAQPGLDVIDL